MFANFNFENPEFFWLLLLMVIATVSGLIKKELLPVKTIFAIGGEYVYFGDQSIFNELTNSSSIFHNL